MKDDTVYLRHIYEAIEKVESYLSDASFESFSQNDMMIDAVVRELEIIGEATGNLSNSFCEKHQQVPWGKVRGIRNVLVHEYYNVDLTIVWDTCKKNLPELKSFIADILD